MPAGTFMLITYLLHFYWYFALGSSTNWLFAYLVIAALHVPSFTFLAGCFPESPAWLAANDRLSEASNSLLFYHGSEDLMDEIMQDVNHAIEMKKKYKQENWWEKYVLLLTLKPLRHPVLISLTILCSSRIINILNYYTTTMLMTAGFSYNKASFWAVMMKCAAIPVYLGSLLVVDKLGRRIVILIGFTGSFVAWFLMGTFEWSVIKGERAFCLLKFHQKINYCKY